MIILAALACAPTPVLAPTDTEVSSTASCTASTTSAVTVSTATATGSTRQPGDYDDPIVRGGDIPLDVSGPELTDAVTDGEILLLAGQEQSGQGGVWAFDLTDPDAPEPIGQTNTWHIQRVCWSGERAFGMTRDGDLMAVAVNEDGVNLQRTWAMADWGAGVDCDGARVAWGMGSAGGAIAADTDELSGRIDFDGEVTDVLLDADTLFVLASDGLRRATISESGLTFEASVALSGSCRDLALGEDWLAVACGAAGVAILDPESLELLGSWSGYASARAVAVTGERVAVAAWTDLLILDVSDPTQPWLRASEPASSAVMAVVAAERLYVADWRTPFIATLGDALAPEVRSESSTAAAGQILGLANDGPEPLWLGTPAAGELSDPWIEPGGRVTWQLPEDASGSVEIATDDPDEATFSVPLANPGGLQVGDAAPNFIEQDTDGLTWELASLRGEVVFLATFEDG